MALSYIPGDPPYYQVTIVVLAKTYSNSMIAALNSRTKVISYSPSGVSVHPSWNESARATKFLQGRSKWQDIEFVQDDCVGTMGDTVWISSTFWYIDVCIFYAYLQQDISCCWAWIMTLCDFASWIVNTVLILSLCRQSSPLEPNQLENYTRRRNPIEISHASSQKYPSHILNLSQHASA